jgi:predicted enzyme related to lactoylglutathione lyase
MQENYLMIQVGENMIGGLRESKGSTPADGPVIYLTVDKLDPAVERAKQLGAELVGEKVVIGEDDGVFHWFRDLDKNLVALWAQN